MRRALAGLVVVLVAIVAPRVRATDDGALRVLPLVVHAPDGTLDAARTAQIDATRDAYAQISICFVVRVQPLPTQHRRLETIRARHALRPLLVERSLNAFLVDRALDPVASESTRRAAARAGFEPSGLLGGAHIPAAGHHPASYAIVTLDGSRFSLAHELGHLLGLPHSAEPTSIMSYSRERARFTESETRTLRRRAQRLIRTREVERAPTQCGP